MSSNRHLVDPKNLNEDVLQNIRVTHNLVLCPKCGYKLVEVCSLNHAMEQSRTFIEKRCALCDIVWSLGLQYHYIRNDRHALLLVGCTNCPHRIKVFPKRKGIVVGLGYGVDVSLGLPCSTCVAPLVAS